MIIYPVEKDALGNVTLYSSGPVFTTVNGKRVWVSSGYQADSRAKIIEQAFANAQMRQLIGSFAGKFCWPK